MSLRVRHCVECPQCHTWYVIGFSPYRNGGYLIASESNLPDHYTLYCLCRGALPKPWKWQRALSCEVTKAAYCRGYGTVDEVWPMTHAIEPRFDLSRYINFRPTGTRCQK